MSDPLTIDLVELAAAFRRQPATMYRVWKDWRAAKGFPAPLTRKPLVWSRAQVAAWCERQGRMPATHAAVQGAPAANDDLLAQDARAVVDRQKLEARYGG